MTPAQQVAIDVLREAFDEATVERMVRAVSPEVEETARTLAASSCRCGLRDEVGAPFFEDGGCWACETLSATGLTPLADDRCRYCDGRGFTVGGDNEQRDCPECGTGTGVCHCGDAMAAHVGMSHNHAPVEMLDPPNAARKEQ